MATKSTTALETPLRAQLDRLASFEPGQGSVISLYLDMRPDQNGQRAHVRVFLRNSVDEQARSLSGRERADFERMVERIQKYLDERRRGRIAAFQGMRRVSTPASTFA